MAEEDRDWGMGSHTCGADKYRKWNRMIFLRNIKKITGEDYLNSIKKLITGRNRKRNNKKNLKV